MHRDGQKSCRCPYGCLAPPASEGGRETSGNSGRAEQSRHRASTSFVQWCAPPSRPEPRSLHRALETAGHVSGAAADLTICTEDGLEVDMGSPEAATPEESDGACFIEAADLPAQAKQNRAVMIEALITVGLVNYPTEWRHWSYGDRYWALATEEPAALYGPLQRI
ncbi:M15 family metallopeptidase [Streptomyces sp. RKAG293]|uniref:M15 family metallopeptidase n=1 Tax=Streptomyces sp. RKAG293 TaxID=2893403 RepID=UPI0027E4ED32|nr:M15 family metallopeptidase [Streptomyces sp. RKAG293]